MPSLASYASNPLKANTVPVTELLRLVCQPTRAEIAAHAKQQKRSAAAIAAGIARMKAKGTW